MECAVCSIENPGNHNSQSCCRACAAFFRRTVQMKLRYKCNKVGNCVVTKDNRFFCKYCRLKRCIKAGMKNFEDPSCSLDDLLDHSEMESPPSIDERDDFYCCENMFKKNGNFYAEVMERADNIFNKSPTNDFKFPLTLAQQAMLAYENHRKNFQIWDPENKISTAKEVDVAQLSCCVFKASECIIEFCMRIRPFAELPLDQKKLLQKAFLNRFLAMEMLYETIQLIGADVNDSRLLHHNGEIFDPREAKLDASRMADGNEELYISMCRANKNKSSKFIEPQFKKVNPDRFEFVFLLLSALFDIARPIEGVTEETMKIAEEVNDQLVEELYFYYSFEKKISNYAKRVYQLHNILICIQRLEDLNLEDSRICKTFEVVNIDERFYEFTIIDRKS